MKKLFTCATAVLFSLGVSLAFADTQTPDPDLGSDDPALQQQVEADEEIATEQKVLDAGHVDLGPKILDGKLQLLVRDDTTALEGGKPVWRHLNDIVIKVNDKAQLALPDDPAYSFTGAAPGDTVWVVPQTEAQGVVWLGWNTQSPEVVSTLERGVTLKLEKVTHLGGDGRMSLFLQPGNFAPPQLLFDGGSTADIWVDLNTHTHANWVFTKPGIYLAQLNVSASGLDKKEHMATAVLRFAVGDQTDIQEALAAGQAEEVPDAVESAQPSETLTQPSMAAEESVTQHPEAAQNTTPVIWIVAAVLVGIAVIAAVVFVVLRRRQVKLEQEVFDGK